MFKVAATLLATMSIGLALPQAASAQDAAAVVAASSKAMGVDGLNALRIYGQATTFTLGQSNRAGGPWPAIGYNDYSRTYDFNQPGFRTTAMFWSLPTGGKAGTARPYEQVVTPSVASWTQQLEIWTSPWGFLKGAAKYGAQVSTATVDGRDYKVLTWSPPQKSPSGATYKVVGYIGPDNLVERTQTWVEETVFGDMEVETRFSTYRDANGVKFPSTTTQKKAGQVSFQLNSLGVAANPADLAALMTSPPASAPPPSAPAPAYPASEKLADDVYRINGSYNALAVGFRDYVVLFEPGPQNPARAAAVIAETKKLFPGKPIRYGVISHHHIDHTGGVAVAAAEGITLVVNEVNKPFFEEALNGPRTLGDDALAKSGKKAVIEAFGDKRVFQDNRHSLEIHLIKGLPHADGLVIGYLPKEKILVYADMFNLPTTEPVTNVIPTRVFLDNIERLGLKPERILSIHSLVPDRLATVQDIRASLGLPN